MTNCIILHGCPGDEEKSMDPERRTYDKHWIPWSKKELFAKGIDTLTPLMPDPWKPDFEAWKEKFNGFEINENTILIGHSCGCAFLVRWLGETGRKIDKLILVAPWKIPDQDNEIRKKFYEYEINSSIKDNIKQVIIFTADDEAEDGKASSKIFHEALGGKLIELKNHGHFCLSDMGTEEFPELLEECLK